jgi:hypothetical protein
MADSLVTPLWRAEILPVQPAEAQAPSMYPPGQIPRDGLWVKIGPAGAPGWWALLARGPHGWTGVCAHPDPEKLVLVAGGKGWIIPAKNGRGAVALPLEPAWDVRHSAPDGVLLVCGGDTVVALDAVGERWRLAANRLRDPNILDWKKGVITLIGETGHDSTDTLTLSALTGEPVDVPPGPDTD